MNGIVQISCLGRFGRFGNQLFQYGFARTYAERLGALLETPNWLGQFLFGLRDAPLSRCLKVLHETELNGVDPANWQTNVDLFGYFQNKHTAPHLSRRKLREWYSVTDEIRKMFPKPPEPYAVCHIRQGDYITTYNSNFCIIDKVCYERALEKYPPNMPVVWVEENKSVPSPNLPHEISWLGDWMTIFNADIVFRGNSTFSWWAATIGHATKIFSPLVCDSVGHNNTIEFTPGNHPLWFPGTPDYEDFYLKE